MEKTAKVTIKGVSPLLFNRFIEASLEGDPPPRAGHRKAEDPEVKLYKTPDGKIYTPYTHLQESMIDAAKNFQIRGKRRATYSKLFGCAVYVEPDVIIHKIQKWEVFSISAVNPNTRGRIMTHRPMLKEWEISFQIVFDDDDIPEEVIKEVLDYAGRRSGVGDWRPNKKGKFGKFMVTKFDAK